MVELSNGTFFSKKNELTYLYVTGKGIPIRNILGKSKMILGLLEGIPTMLKGEVAMVLLSL